MTVDLADQLDAVPREEYALLEYAAAWEGLGGVAAQLAAAVRVFVITRDPLGWLPGRGSVWATANADGDTVELPVYVTHARAGNDTEVLAALARRVLVNAIANQGAILAGSYAALVAVGACPLLVEPEASGIELPQVSLRSRGWEPLGLGAIQDLVQDVFGFVDFDRSKVRLDPVRSPVPGCPACAGGAFGFPADVTVAAGAMCAPHYEAATALIDARIVRARTSNPAGWRAIGKACARTSGSPDLVRAPQPPRRIAIARRNDPCPCGSGQKYKRCCGG